MLLIPKNVLKGVTGKCSRTRARRTQEYCQQVILDGVCNYYLVLSMIKLNWTGFNPFFFIQRLNVFAKWVENRQVQKFWIKISKWIAGRIRRMEDREAWISMNAFSCWLCSIDENPRPADQYLGCRNIPWQQRVRDRDTLEGNVPAATSWWFTVLGLYQCFNLLCFVVQQHHTLHDFFSSFGIWFLMMILTH